MDFTYRGQPRSDIPDAVTRVFVDESIDTVLAEVFAVHPSIEEVFCHVGVEKVEGSAFCDCERLRRVVMRGVLVVENMAFLDCPVLTDVECDALEIIGEAFACCPSLRSINLSSVRVVKKHAFKDCRALTSAIFGDQLERIEEFAFSSCPSLERITIPLKDGMITDDDVFQGCESLRHVDLVEGEASRTVADLQLEDWRDDVNREIHSIHLNLPSQRAG